MAGIALRMRPFVIPHDNVRQTLAEFRGRGYRPIPRACQTFALADMHARRGVPVYFNGQVFYMRARADVSTCIQLNLLPADTESPYLVPTDRVSSRFAPPDVALLRASTPNFAEIIARNTQSAYDLGLYSRENPLELVLSPSPSRPRSPPATPEALQHTADALPSGEPATSGASSSRRRSPYMTRARSASIRALDADLAARSGEPHIATTTAVGPRHETTTSRTPPPPLVDTAAHDIAAAGERVVPDGTAKTNQRL